MITRTSCMAAVIAGFLLAAGCTSTPAPVETAETKAYPNDRYLVATGYGTTAVDAGREARAAMAAIFSSRVYSETMAEATSAFGLDGEEQFQKRVASSVQVISDVALEGVSLVDKGKDPESGTYKALAVLDRRQAGARWQRELDAVSDRLAAEAAALPSVRGDLFRLAALNRIATQSLQQEALMSRLRVVGGTTAMAADPIDLKPVAEELTALRQTATLAVVLEGAQAAAATRSIRSGLSAEGILMADDAASAAGRVTGTVELQPLSIQHPTARFVRAVITADVVDATTGVSLKSVTAKQRKAHQDELEATRMAVSAASAQVVAEIAEALGQMGIAAP
jgi:hypothetical protein